LRAAEAAGLKVFPSSATYAHFDDKVAQKYLLEAIGAPLVPTFVAHDIDSALRFVTTAKMPMVFKLRRGAGSSNVRLIRDRHEALAVCRQAFAAGFVATPSYTADFARKARDVRSLRVIASKLARAPQMIRRAIAVRAALPRERGYVYFQDFVPGATHDVRVTVIGRRAFTFRRRTRPGDFRASGSGLIEHCGPEDADREAVRCAFEMSASLNGDSLAFDFIVDGATGRRLVVEMSYAYQAQAVHDCPGHFAPDLSWVPGYLWPQQAILDDLCAAIRESRLGR
jgi:glutathione synthase/RimK-type ligase-like ATP-grasp enzyme